MKSFVRKSYAIVFDGDNLLNFQEILNKQTKSDMINAVVAVDNDVWNARYQREYGIISRNEWNIFGIQFRMVFRCCSHTDIYFEANFCYMYA